MTHLKANNLWKHSDFMKLWSGQTLSMFGSQVTLFAIPLIALLTLQASVLEIGILKAVEYVPFLLFSLHAGSWVDRHNRHQIMLLMDIVRGIVLLIIPFLALLELLNFQVLLVVSFIIGTCSVFFDIAYMSYLPKLVSKEHIIEANSKLELSRSASNLMGKSLAGAIVQIFSPPMSLLVNAFSFFGSAFTLILMKTKKIPTENNNLNSSITQNIKEGLQYVWSNPILSRIFITSGLYNLFYFIFEPSYLMFVTRDLGISPLMLGFILSTGGVGAILGALFAKKISQKLYLGKSIVYCVFLSGLLLSIIPTLGLMSKTTSIIFLMIVHLLSSIMLVSYNINQISLRTASTSDNFLGRMNACMRVSIYGSISIGGALGGILGQWINVSLIILIGSVGIMLTAILIRLSPIYELKRIPESEKEVTVA